MRKSILTIIIATAMVLLISCESGISKKAVEQGKLALAAKEYDKALNAFQLAQDEGSKDKEIQDMINVIESYLSSEKLFVEGKLEEANEMLNNLLNYDEYVIADDIEILKGKISGGLEEIKLISEEIKSLEDMFGNKNYDEAKELAIKLSSMNVSEEQVSYIDEIMNKIEVELAEAEAKRLQAEEEERKKTEEEKQQTNINEPIQLSEVLDYVSQFARDGEIITSVLGSGVLTKGFDVTSNFNIPSTEKNDDFYTVLTDFGQRIEEGFVVNIRNRNVYNSYGEKVN